MVLMTDIPSAGAATAADIAVDAAAGGRGEEGK